MFEKMRCYIFFNDVKIEAMIKKKPKDKDESC